MKRICKLLLCLPFIFSASQAQVKSGFNIEGNVKGLKNGSQLCILIKRADKRDTVGRAVAQNGVFKFKNVKLPIYPDFYLLCVQTEFVENLKLFLDQAGDVKIKGDLKSWLNVQVTGSETHQDYLTCRQLRKDIQAKDFLIKYPEGSAPADTVTMYVLKECAEMIRQRPDSYYLAYWLATMQHPLEAMGYTFSPEKKKPLYESLSAKVKAGKYGKILEQQITEYTRWQECIGQLKSAANGLPSITCAAALEELKGTAGLTVAVKQIPLLNNTLAEVDLLEKLKKAVLIVNMAYKKAGVDGMQTNPTTAYVIDESGICVTNYHVGKEYSTKPYASLSVMTTDSKSYPVTKILSCSESDDLMIFQVDTKGDQLSALALGNAAAKGASIHIMAHPKANFYHFSSGVISDYSTSTLAGKDCAIMSITADFNVGSSGGPIVDGYGNVVGTVSRIDGGMKVGVPVSELRKLIEFKK